MDHWYINSNTFKAAIAEVDIDIRPRMISLSLSRDNSGHPNSSCRSFKESDSVFDFITQPRPTNHVSPRAIIFAVTSQSITAIGFSDQPRPEYHQSSAHLSPEYLGQYMSDAYSKGAHASVNTLTRLAPNESRCAWPAYLYAPSPSSKA